LFGAARFVAIVGLLMVLPAATTTSHARAMTRAGNGGAYTVTDPTGDAGDAPDISSLQMSADDTGLATFDVAVPIASTDTSSIISLFIDSDHNSATGDPNSLGTDYEIDSYQQDHSFSVEHWDSTQNQWVDASSLSTVAVSWDATGITFQINRSELGNASNIGVLVQSVTSDAAYGPGHFDNLPNNGTVAFNLSPLTLNVAAAKTVATKGAFVLTMLVKRSDSGGFVSGTDGTLTCKATVAGKTIPVAVSGFITTSNLPIATCAWHAAAKYKGKVYRATMTIAVGTKTVSKTVTGKVK
jgi:hypothetical protein